MVKALGAGAVIVLGACIRIGVVGAMLGSAPWAESHHGPRRGHHGAIGAGGGHLESTAVGAIEKRFGPALDSRIGLCDKDLWQSRHDRGTIK